MTAPPPWRSAGHLLHNITPTSKLSTMFADHYDDDLDDLALLYDVQRRARAPTVQLYHLDPTEQLLDAVFKRHYRFDKAGICHIAGVLNLERENDCGRPFSAVQQVCLVLNF